MLLLVNILMNSELMVKGHYLSINVGFVVLFNLCFANLSTMISLFQSIHKVAFDGCIWL